MRVFNLFILFLFVPLLFVGQTVVYTVQPDEAGIDANLNRLNNTTNFGDSETLRASRAVSTFYERAILKFDLSALQPGIEVTSAQLVLYGINHQGSGSGTGVLQMVPDKWEEDLVTWSNAELLKASDMPTLSLSSPSSSTQNYTLDVTSMVQTMVNTPEVNFGWLLRMALEDNSSNRNFEFGSSDNSNSALRPKLIVTYAQPVTVNAFVSSAEKDTSHNAGIFLDVSGGVAPYSYNWSNSKTTKDNYNISPGVQQFTVTDSRGVKAIRPVPVTSDCGTVTYTVNYSSPGSFSDVVLLKESFNNNTQNRNFGTSPDIVAYNKTTSSGNSVARSLLAFDLNSLPVNAHINSAVLKLTDNGPTFSGTFKVQLCRVSQSWDERTVTNNTQPAYVDSVSDIIEFDYDGSQSVYDFNVTSHLQKMVNSGNTKTGWLLRLKSETESTYGKSVTFIGNDNTSGTKPVLVLQVSFPDNPCDDYSLNWHQEDFYDENGAVISSKKTYLDNLGRETQNLVKNASNDVFTSQVVYDSYGRPALNTMGAYTGSQLVYRPGFVRGLNGQAYQYTNFDTPSKLNNPDAIQNGVLNTLGSYYSNNNTYDAFQAIADNPYTRFEYEGSPGGAARRVSRPGNAFKMGSKREDYSFTMISGDELVNVYGANTSFKAKEASNNNLDCSPLTISNKLVATKQLAITPDNKEVITYSVGDKLLATCYSGLTNGDACSYAVYNKLYYSGTRSTDVHLPDANKSSLALQLPVQSGDILPMPANKITFKITDLYRDVVLVDGVDYSIDVSTRLVSFNTNFLNLYTGRGLVLRISFVYDPVYEAGLNGPADVVINYVVDYGRFSKNYYDLSGALLKSVSPKGFGCSNPNTITMATTFNYNRKGQLIARKSPDEGIVEVKYDIEGKPRFWQNAVQATGNRFGYVNYDKHGRAYETGEYQSTTAAGSVWFNTIQNPHPNIVYTSAIIDQSNGLPTADKSFVTEASYTVPAAGAADDIPNTYSYYNQYRSFRNGRINFVKNQNKTVWYNYDKVDRGLASVTRITEPDFVAKNPGINNQIKTSESSYNYFNGLTSSSTYQLNNSNEKLLYQFTYDVNLRPNTSSITYGSITQQLSANSYDKSGRLKRVVAGNNLQGTDFVYTLNGGLKAINHPALDPGQDPGGDSGDYIATTNNVNKDLFGEIMDYYAGDYERNNTYISSSIGAMSSKYDHLIYATRFKTRGTVGPVQSRANFVDYGGANQDSILTGSVYSQKEFRFEYTYDEFNQLARSAFGTYNNSTNSFSQYTGYAEKGPSNGNIGYDKNGNITNLVRQAYRNVSNNTAIVLDDLTYTNASASNQLTAIVDAASNSFPQSVNFRTPSLSTASSFVYNGIGQLTQNLAEDISGITYFPDGKVKKITFNSTGNTTEYEYGPGGEKVKSKYHINSSNKNKYTWYVGPYIYEYNELDPTPAFKIAEAKIQGGAIRVNNSINVGSGYIVYYVTDHLGNLRATYKSSGTGNGITLLSRDDYYAFGGQMPGRSWKTEDSRYAYQGQEKANETNPWDQFELRMYNHDLGRWFAPDPYGQFSSPYIGMANNPVSNVDPDGGWVNAAPGRPHDRFLGAEEMRVQRENRTGAFSVEYTQKRYNEEYDNMRKHFQNGSYDEQNDIEGWLNAVQALNSRYYGLTIQSGQQPAYNAGFDALTLNELGSVSTVAYRNGSTINAMRVDREMNFVYLNTDVYRAERQAQDKSTRAKGVTRGASMANGSGHIEITYYGDGSEVHQYYDENGDLSAEGYRSPEYAAHLAHGGTLGNFDMTGDGDPKKQNAQANGGSQSGQIMAGALVIGGLTSELPPVAAVIVAGGAIAAAAVYAYEKIGGKDGYHTTYEHVSQNPIHIQPRGIGNPKEPQKTPNFDKYVGWGVMGALAYKVGKNFDTQTNNFNYNFTPAARDNTFVSPTIGPPRPR